MTRKEIYDMADGYVNLVTRLINKPSNTVADKQKLRATGSALLHAIEKWKPNSNAATLVKRALAAERRAAEPFTITFRDSGGVEEVVGWETLSERLGLMASTLRVLLSRGKGTHKMGLYTAVTNLHESVTVRQVNWQPSKGGRPRRMHKEE